MSKEVEELNKSIKELRSREDEMAKLLKTKTRELNLYKELYSVLYRYSELQVCNTR